MGEPNDKRLAYILTSGSVPDGALNVAIIQRLMPTVLEHDRHRSMDEAWRTNLVNWKIVTQAAVTFATKIPRELNPRSEQAAAAFYDALYERIDLMKPEAFRALIYGALKKYESQSWGPTLASWGLASDWSRRNEVINYLRGAGQVRSLGLILIIKEKRLI